MPDAAVYYYPTPGDYGLKKIDVGADMSDLQDSIPRKVTVTESLTGRTDRTYWNARQRVVAVFGPFQATTTTGEELKREFLALENHLQRGGHCIISEDGTRMWAGFLDTQPVPGATSFKVGPSVLDDVQSATLAAGDTLILTGPSPEYVQQRVLIDSVSGFTVNIAGEILFDFSDMPWVHARLHGTWDNLHLDPAAQNTPVLAHTSRTSYTFTLNLIEDPATLAAMAGTEQALPGAGDDITPGLEDLATDIANGQVDGTDPVTNPLRTFGVL